MTKQNLECADGKPYKLGFITMVVLLFYIAVPENSPDYLGQAMIQCEFLEVPKFGCFEHL